MSYEQSVSHTRGGLEPEDQIYVNKKRSGKKDYVLIILC